MSDSDPALLALLYRALRETIGLSIATDDPERLRQKLYQIRAKEMDPALMLLMLAPDPKRPTTHLFIAKTKVKLEGEPDAETSTRTE